MTRIKTGYDRRRILQGMAGGITAAGGMTLFGPAVHAAKTIKIGYVSPKSGPLAAFAEADDFVLGEFRKSVKDGLKLGSQVYQVEIITKDSQSNPNRAAEVTKELITRDNVGLVLVGATPETNNPVSTQCELEQIPCISSVAPWQTNFIARQANPGDPKSWKPFDYTFHYFWGLEDVIGVFTGMWNQVATNKSVGALFPNDGDGNAWGDKVVGFPPVLAKQGFTLTDPGRFQNLTDDFSAQIIGVSRRQCGDRDRRRDPAGFHDVLESVAAEGIQAQSSVGRQGSVVSDNGAGARQKRAQHFHRGVVDPEPSLQVEPDRASAPPTSPRATSRRPASNGPSRSASCIRCSRLPSIRSSAPRIRPTAPHWRKRSAPPNSIPWSVRSHSAPTRCRRLPRRTSPRRRWSAVNGGWTATNTTWSSPRTARRRKFLLAGKCSPLN